MDSTPVSTKKTIGLFALLYVATALGVAVLGYVFELESNLGVNIGMLYAVGYGTAISFVTTHRRAPDKTEKNRLIWGCLLATIVLSVFLAAGFLQIEVLRGDIEWADTGELMGMLPAYGWVLVFAGVLALHYLVLYLCFGWMAGHYARKCLVKLQEKPEPKG